MKNMVVEINGVAEIERAVAISVTLARRIGHRAAVKDNRVNENGVAEIDHFIVVGVTADD